MRTWRHNKKYKYGDQGASVRHRRDASAGETSESDSSSLGSIGSRSRSPTPRDMEVLTESAAINNISEADYTEFMDKCRTLCEAKSPKRGDVKSILRKTFVSRRKEIKKMNKDKMPMISSIMADWNCFQYGDFVSISVVNIGI